MQFSEKLYNLRRDIRWSQETLAEKLNVGRHTISRWEAGTSMPETPHIIAIAELFEVSTDYLLNDKIESSTGKLTEYQCAIRVFLFCTISQYVGLILSIIGWCHRNLTSLIIIGFFVKLIALVGFLVFHPREDDKVPLRYTKRQFVTVSVWLGLPTPIYFIIQLFTQEGFALSVLPYLIGLGAYIVLALILSIILNPRKNKKK